MGKILMGGDPDARRGCFCFKGSKGTANMRGIAKALGVEVFDV
jgi:hypothetical protein